MVKTPKTLIIDIETSPIKAYTWGPKWETNIVDFIEYGQVISYSAKWLRGKQETKGLCDYKGYKPGVIDDKKIIVDLHTLLDESDIVVAQNGIDFDLKYLNTRFLKHGLPPPSPYKVVDTKREAKKYLRLPSNKLDDMGSYFGLGKKLEHEGFPLWLKCEAGNKAAWAKMKRYNAQDVKLTEEVYLKLRPFMKSHPNLGSFAEAAVCVQCGSAELQKRGYSRTTSSVFQRFQCTSCGSWGRSTVKEKGFKPLMGV
jgi:DNA polymerase elongation subunit (family B)